MIPRCTNPLHSNQCIVLDMRYTLLANRHVSIMVTTYMRACLRKSVTDYNTLFGMLFNPRPVVFPNINQQYYHQPEKKTKSVRQCQSLLSLLLGWPDQ